MPDTEELAGAMEPRIVTDGNLGHAASGKLEFPGHFHTDDAASRFQCDLLENVAAEETEVAVHVSNRESKDEAHAAPVHFADDDAVPGVRALHFVAVDQVDVRPKFGEKIVNLTDIVLSVAIGVEDDVLCGVSEAGNQRGAITPISVVVDDAQETQLHTETFQNFPGFVSAPVVDNEHFEIVCHLAHF